MKYLNGSLLEEVKSWEVVEFVITIRIESAACFTDIVKLEQAKLVKQCWVLVADLEWQV